MPFVNVSGDPSTEYLSDGLSYSIINNLSQLPSLKKVSAFNSVLHYKGKQTDPQVVGRELNVRAVLIGRFTQRGDNPENLAYDQRRETETRFVQHEQPRF